MPKGLLFIAKKSAKELSVRRFSIFSNDSNVFCLDFITPLDLETLVEGKCFRLTAKIQKVELWEEKPLGRGETTCFWCSASVYSRKVAVSSRNEGDLQNDRLLGSGIIRNCSLQTCNPSSSSSGPNPNLKSKIQRKIANLSNYVTSSTRVRFTNEKLNT